MIFFSLVIELFQAGIIGLRAIVVSIAERIWSVTKQCRRRSVPVNSTIDIIRHYENVAVIQVPYAIGQQRNVSTMQNAVMALVNVLNNSFLMTTKSVVCNARDDVHFIECRSNRILSSFSRSMSTERTQSSTYSLSGQLSTIHRLPTEVKTNKVFNEYFLPSSFLQIENRMSRNDYLQSTYAAVWLPKECLRLLIVSWWWSLFILFSRLRMLSSVPSSRTNVVNTFRYLDPDQRWLVLQ